MADTKMTRTPLARSGIGTIFLADPEVISASTTWTEVFQSTKDSITITQEQGDATEIFVDQRQAAVSVKYGTGSFNIEFSTPDIGASVLKYLFEASDLSYAPTNMEAIGISTKLKIVNKMFRIDWAEGGSIIITNAQMIGSFSKTGDGPMSINISVTALAAGGTGKEASEVILWNPTGA